MDVDVFRRGLFSLRTRRFGKVAEILIRNLLSLSPGQNQYHDLYDYAFNERIEVKSGIVYKKHPVSITRENVLDIIEHSGNNWIVQYENYTGHEFDVNIQQIKPTEFEHLFYGLFFYDEVLLFRLTSQRILTNPDLAYCPKQHKGNLGEGQFHIDHRSLSYHVENYLFNRLTYRELLQHLSRNG